tara:strand:+ start:621 stop:1055 length:435 start_codon:yes stop_codon:yes gene_type:complete
MLIRNKNLQLLNELSGMLGSRLQDGAQDDSNVESSRWLPAVDIKEEPDKFLLVVDLPGVDPGNVEISMEDNVLTLKGSREEAVNDEAGGYHRVERTKGSFYRRFTLPDAADAEQVAAKSKHGVLDITIRKKKAVQARKITVEAS